MLCGSQQGSLEEGEERYRALADTHDALRHAGLQAKAQLVTVQAQVRARGGREGGPVRCRLPAAALAQNACRRCALEWLTHWVGCQRVHARYSPAARRRPQVGELRAARDELAAQVSGLEGQAAALRGEVEARKQR